MPVGTVVATATVVALATLALVPWARRLVTTNSRWLRPGPSMLLGGAGGAGAAVLARDPVELVAFAVLGIACALLVVLDLSAHRLPDAVVAPAYLLFLPALAVAAGVNGDWSRLGRAGLAACTLLVGYFVLAFISPSNLGLGDVKLAGLLGAFLGWLGWSHTLLGSMAAFILSGGVSIVLTLGAGASRRTAYAFGPWMVAGAAIGAAGGPLLSPGG